jgi:polysaccharide pyruvyl transferase WcaK-like protein
MRSTFILYGNGSLLNRGCEAIYRSTVAMLRDEFGDISIIYAPNARAYPPGFCEQDSSVMHVLPKAFTRFDPRWFAYQARRLTNIGIRPQSFDAYIDSNSVGLALGGDNYTLDYGNPSRFFQMDAAFLRRKQITALWGASVGPFSSSRKFEAKAASHLRDVTLIFARENYTVDYLESIGVHSNVVKVADPAFLLEPKSCEVDERVMRALRSGAIGINLSPILGRRMTLDVPWEEHAAKCVTEVLKTLDVQILLVPHVFGPGQNNDLAFLQRVHSRLAEEADRCSVVKGDYTASELKWIISQLRGFVGARTHATIAAISSAVPTLSIAYSQKARGLNAEIFGSEEWVLELRELKPTGFASRIKDLDSRRHLIASDLARRIPVVRAEAGQAVRILRTIVAND